MKFLASEEWRRNARDEQELVASFVASHLERRRLRQKHPVWDFLFEYYSFKPSFLSRYSPGIGVELEDGAEFTTRSEWKRTERGSALDNSRFPLHRLDGARDILALLEATEQRLARHDCFGWHEWAMVYRAEETRHAQPLRLSHDAIATLLESQTLRCSHFDAVRFWTPEALPLNTMSPKSHDRSAWEQPGCIHANMDLYKFAAKFAPWIPSRLMIEAFVVAKFARELDMRASPYELSAFGFEPVRLETAEGRREYAVLQREVALRAAPIRSRLIEAYKTLIEAVG
ncbi:3-methyladenine DNA glycosylase [bacterium]|nr:MAG: 3-methyladenine DNA glycosylase [bacterium]